MKKSLRFTLAALVLAAASSGAQAGVIANWGNISAPGATFDFGRTFTSTTSFSDDYLFTLGGSGSASGDLDTFSGFISFIDLDLSSIKLFKDGGLFATDASPTSGFSFAGLTAGNYSLQVNGKVTGWDFLGGKVGYDGDVTIRTAAAAVPEPATFALLGAGLAALGFARRRKVAVEG